MNNDYSEKKVILAVDDNPQLLTTITTLLKSDYRVIAVTNGAAAIKVMDKFTPSLFIIDIEMPGMDGYALASIIRGRDIYKHTPILFLTSQLMQDAVMAAIKFGGTDFIIKPVDKEVLLSKIGIHLAG